MSVETDLAELNARASTILTRQNDWVDGQVALIAGTANDPDSFNQFGGKTGALGYYPVRNVNGQTIFIPCIDRVKADTLALSGEGAEQAGAYAEAAQAAADRADLAEESVADTSDAKDTITAGRDSVAVGQLFRVFDPDGTIRTYRKTGASTQTEKRVSKSSLLIDADRVAAIAAESTARNQAIERQAGTPRVAALHMRDGMVVLAEDKSGAIFYIDPVKGLVYLHNLVLDGGDGMVQGGAMPLIRTKDGQSLLSFDVFDKLLVAEHGEVVGRPIAFDFDFLRVTERNDVGQPLAGYEPGQRIRFHPKVLDGLTIQGDVNKIPQLWSIIDSPHGPTRMRRQLTFSQHGVTGFQVISRPRGATPGLIRISCNDTDPIRDRHKVRHAHWHLSEPATAAPTKIVYIVVIGQSNSVGAGSYGTNPTSITGPQTIRAAMPIRNAPFASRLLTWNGGTIPHQGNLDGDVNIGGGVMARDVPIDPTRIATLVPMREGFAPLAHAQGGATRESFVTAMATHLNGPNGYDGSVYLAGASFGFGSSTFAALVHDGASRKQAWLNALASIDQAKSIANVNGLALEVHVLIDQGEGDWSNASYRAQVEAAWAVMKTDITSRTAQAVAPQLFYHQTIVARGSFAEPAYSALAQVEMARNNADIHILPPHYFTDYDTDAVHYKAPEETWRGALSGEAMADWLIRGEDAALLIDTATWTGSTMTIGMNHSVTRDAETIILTSGNGGVTHANSNGSTASISSVLIDRNDATKLVLTTSTAIAADAVETARIAYGNQTTTNPPSQGWGGGPSGGGQRSVFKRADWRRYSLIDGRPLDIFATIQTFPATKEA